MTAKIDRDMRQDIADVLVRYATGIDRRDWVLFRTCFTDDCDADYGEVGSWSGADSITEWMERVHARCGYSLHRITNQDITLNGEGASARCYVDAIVMADDNQAGARTAGFFDDELVHTGEGWKIARRRYTMVLFQTARNESRPRP